MKKIVASILATSLLLTSCGKVSNEVNVTIDTTSDATFPIESTAYSSTYTTVSTDITSIESTTKPDFTIPQPLTAEELGFYGLNDSRLHQYINDAVYSDLEITFADSGYQVENVSCIYKSKEYLDNLAYNSKENIYFGYTLSELEEQFEGKKYVFSVDEAGKTIVKEFENYDDTYDRVLRNVAIGTGVILVCVTVSVATGGTASVIMAASAKTATTFALSTGAISGISTALVTGLETRDFDKTVKAAALNASEGFMWGAIAGAVIGGASEAYKLKTAIKPIDEIPSWRQSEIDALKKYNGIDEQVSFLNGEVVPRGTPGSTRPDVLRYVDNKLEAIEVKNYDLENNVGKLCSEVRREVENRITECPKDTLQRLVLDVRGRGYSNKIIDNAKNAISNKVTDLYPNLPIDIMI